MATTPRAMTPAEVDYRRAVGASVRALREAHGWSLSHAAALAGWDITYQSHLEAGRKSPSWPTLLALADLLEVPPSRILATAEKILRENRK